MINIELLNKAVDKAKSGEYQEAEKIYQKLVAENPNDSNLLSFVGLFYIQYMNYEKAIEYLKKSYEINKTLGTVSALGFAYYEANNLEKATETLIEALNYGETPDIYDKIIRSYFKTKHYREAVQYSQIMFSKYPENVKTISNLVKSKTYSGELLEAEKICVDFLKQHPDSAEMWFHLGYLKELIYCDDKQALECYKAASELGSVEAFYNIAVSYQKQGDYKNAEINFKKILEFKPDDGVYKSSLGMCYLKQKKFKEGYDLFFQREKTLVDSFTNNPWKPGDKFDKNIVILCDQGYGDNIQFMRYIPFLKEKTEQIFIAARRPIIPIFEKFCPYAKVIEHKDVDSNMQSIRITDLAYVLDIDFEHIPFSEGYLKYEKTEIKSDKPKIGLCWEAGSAGIRTMLNRTINIKEFERILNLENIQVYSFQVDDTLKGNERYPQMINLAKDFKTFEDTAKAMSGMDLIISVDTAVAHLAGALGVKTWLLIPYTNDWRWFDDTKTTPWYDSIEIFKQQDNINWEKELGEIECRLKEFSL